MNNAFRVGITGGIGSGKSAVTRYLDAKGIQIVDADLIAREVVEVGSDALKAIAKHFGDAVIHADGRLDRGALRQIVFSRPDERQWLEALTHPLIGASIHARLETASSPYVVLSSPLLLEGSQKDAVEHIVVVDVPESVQLSRTVSRDNNTEELVRAIMSAQMARQMRLDYADEVIDNSGSLETLKVQVDALDGRLRELAKARART